jgi:hypothetical protein
MPDLAVMHAPPTDRTRANTWETVNRRVDRQTQLIIGWAAGGASSDQMSSRLERLNHEWNFDRVLEAEAAFTGLLGVALAARLGGPFLAMPAVVAAMLLVHGVHGWYPLLPFLRRLGFRTQDEIDRERFALKAIRGDFFGIPGLGAPDAERASAAWSAVCA